MKPLSEQELRELLKASRVRAPRDLAGRVMERLPAKPGCGWWPLPSWTGGAFAGVTVILVALLVMNWQRADRSPALPPGFVNVHFELHAPGAQVVELVGTFNHWRPGSIRLRGPDASGYWTTTVALAEGRYEYLFLVNGRQWVTDPKAAVLRPDGFGQINAIVEVAAEGTVL
jgi:hypothetical protein